MKNIFLLSVVTLVCAGCGGESTKRLEQPQHPITRYDGLHLVLVSLDAASAKKGCVYDPEFLLEIKNGAFVSSAEQKIAGVIDVQKGALDGTIIDDVVNYSFSGFFEPQLHGDWISSDGCSGTFKASL